MKLITEEINDIQVLTEGYGENKKHFIHGIFMQSEVPNRNKRIYPKSILENEVSRYVKENVSTSRAYGELGHPCFGPTAQILTSNGWKYIKDTSPGELVYTLEPNSRTIELHPIEKVEINHYTGKMLNIKNKTFNTTVTPYHKFPVYYRNGKAYQITAGEIKENLDNNIASMSKFSIPKTANFNKNTTTYINIGENSYNLDIFAQFLSLYLAEGHTKKRKDRNNLYEINIYQNEGEKAKKIDILLNQTGFNWHRYSKNNKVVWSCYNNHTLGEYLFNLGIYYNKYIPSEIINKISSETAEKMLEWYVLGDGRGNITKGNHIRADIFSTSKQLINDMSIVAVKAGYAFREHVYIEENDVIIENRVIKAENKKPLYFLQLLKTENIYLDKRHIQITEIDWDDNVYCVSVKNGTFLAKDNGYCFWSGNCGPSINLDRACILIKELKQDKNNFIGKAQITSTPMGDIVKGLLSDGANLGVSSRALGSLKPLREGINEVQNDLKLLAVDVVADPSAPNAYVNGIMENVEYWYDAAKGTIIEQRLDDIKKDIRSMSINEIEENKLRLFEEFINSLVKR